MTKLASSSMSRGHGCKGTVPPRKRQRIKAPVSRIPMDVGNIPETTDNNESTPTSEVFKVIFALLALHYIYDMKYYPKLLDFYLSFEDKVLCIETLAVRKQLYLV